MDYAYPNARIRAMKGQLLSDGSLESLINKPDLDTLIAELAKTTYRQELEKASVQFSGITQLEVALRKDLISAFRRILHFMKDEEDRTYLYLILHRWDVQNIKTILRGKRIQTTPEEIVACLIPAGELDEAALIELSKQPDVKSVIDILATWRIEYAKPLNQHLKEYNEKRDMAILEYALDTYFFEYALSMVKGEADDDRIMRDFLIDEIDVTNIKTVLKMVRDQIEPEEAEKFFIKGSISLSPEKLLTLIRLKNIDAVVKELSGTTFHFLASVPEKYLEAGKISELEKELDRYLVKRGVRHFLADPLTIALALGYVWAKINEVTNIRIIGRGKTADVTEKELREALIRV